MQVRVNDKYENIDFGNNFTVDVPAQFICPINLDVMQLPLLASDGYSYEGNKILQWMHAAPRAVSPKAHDSVLKKSLTFNWSLYQLIREFFDDIYKKNEVLLNDGNHEEAKTKINLHRQPIHRDGPVVTDVQRQAAGGVNFSSIEILALDRLGVADVEHRVEVQAAESEIHAQLDLHENVPQEFTSTYVLKQAGKYFLASMPATFIEELLLVKDKDTDTNTLLITGMFFSLLAWRVNSNYFPFPTAVLSMLLNLFVSENIAFFNAENKAVVVAAPTIAVTSLTVIPSIACISYIKARNCYRSVHNFFHRSPNELQQPLRADADAERVLNRV